MALAAHVFPFVTSEIGLKNISFTGDTLQVALIAQASTAYVFDNTDKSLSDFMANSAGGGALTEQSTGASNYSRQNLTSVTFTTSGLVNMLSCAGPSWASSSIAATYAVFYDTTYTISASPALICYWDFGGIQSTSTATFTLSINASGLVTWTSS